MLAQALAKESDPDIKALLEQVHAGARLASPSPADRLAAVNALAGQASPETRSLLLPLQDAASEPDAQVRAAAAKAIRAIESRLAIGETLGQVFTGLSLGSILLLAALGLAITYGVMGVINMAHGELLMVGAYATYLRADAVPQPICRSTSTGICWRRSRSPSLLPRWWACCWSAR